VTGCPHLQVSVVDIVTLLMIHLASHQHGLRTSTSRAGERR
jgi:hypothetical protein